MKYALVVALVFFFGFEIYSLIKTIKDRKNKSK